MSPGRPICARCRRPTSVCFCAHIPSLRPRARVVFLQHPREKRVAISTCRMAHLALVGSELHHGIVFTGNPAVESLSARGAAGGVAVLFPGEGAIDPSELPPGVHNRLTTVFDDLFGNDANNRRHKQDVAAVGVKG